MKTPLTSSSGASQESEQETHYTKGGPRSSTAATLQKADDYSDSGVMILFLEGNWTIRHRKDTSMNILSVIFIHMAIESFSL
jgi:hypothetical protein